jgi:D-3-phosphoglycerate dehydrogenase
MTIRIWSTSPSFGYFVAGPVNFLKSLGYEMDFVPQGKKLSEEEMIKSVKDYDAIIAGIMPISGPIIKAAPKLRIIAQHGVGVNHIDVKAASEKGIVVTNAPGGNSDAVADLTMGLFISLARRIPYADRSVRNGQWAPIVGNQVSGKVLGIVGLGQIGKKVAQRGVGFNMEVLAYDVFKDYEFAQKWGIQYLSLDDVLAQADYISMHVPLSPETNKLIGERELRLMKKDACLVNVARGTIMDEESLYRVLKEGRIKGAALDVFSNEPPTGNPLLTLDNVIVTPHMDGWVHD